MTDLQRKNVKIFAINSGAQGTSEFGSLKSTGSFVFSQDINDLQTSEYETGWRGAVVNGKTPTIPDFNTISRVISEQVAYLYQKGMAEWSSEQTYFIGNKCMIINNGVPQEYYSLTDNNIGNNPLNDTTNWKNINDLIFENISNSYVDLDGSNATFTSLSLTAKNNIKSLFLKETITINSSIAEIEFTNINDGYQHKFEFISLETDTNSYMNAVLGNSSSYINNGYSNCLLGRWSDHSNPTQWLTDSVANENSNNLLITSNHNNYWYLSNQNSYVNFTILSNLSENGNQFFEFNSMINSSQQLGRLMVSSGNGMLIDGTNLDRIKFYLSSGNFTNGIIKHYIF